MAKEKVFFVTQQNLGSDMRLLDVWDCDPRKVKGWLPHWKCYKATLKEMKPLKKKLK